jgi:hypothetical protein
VPGFVGVVLLVVGLGLVIGGAELFFDGLLGLRDDYGCRRSS